MPQKRWDKHAIKAEIHRRGATLTGLAEAAGIGAAACRVALFHHRPGGERVIADFLGLDPTELWPDRYPAQRSKASTSEAHSKRRGRPRKSQITHLRTDTGEAA